MLLVIFAPQNQGFLWQFRLLIIRRQGNLLCRWKCPWFGHLKLFSLVSRTPQRKATVAVQDSMVQLKFLKSANTGWKTLQLVQFWFHSFIRYLFINFKPPNKKLKLLKILIDLYYIFSTSKKILLQFLFYIFCSVVYKLLGLSVPVAD